jgi:DNA-binding NarL/FixJ family response regulator
MRRVLIVDDDPRVRAALTALIAATADLTVTAAVGTARDACTALATRPVDLILIDVHLPHPDDGITLIQTLSRRYLVVAMSIDGSSRAPALRAGVADFLEKNGNPDDILEALRRPLPPGSGRRGSSAGSPLCRVTSSAPGTPQCRPITSTTTVRW